VSSKLKRQIAVEREQLRRLLEVHRPLLVKCGSLAPDAIELSALAALLHAFYTGIENILKRVAVEVDGRVPAGELWHRQLLDQVAGATAQRPAVISPGLPDTLRGYLDFRHVFRQAYTFELRREKMTALVRDLDAIFREVETELDLFCARLPCTRT